MALCTGHFQLQYGLPQSRQRPAWYCASSLPNLPYSSPQSPDAQFHRDALRHGAGQVEELEGVLAAHGGL
jgi:hypothetical protein